MGRFSKLPYFDMRLGHWQNIQKLSIYSLSTPWGQNWAYFRSTGSTFQKLHANILIFLPKGIEFERIFALQAMVSEIWAYFQICHIWALNLASGQIHRSGTYTLFLSQGVAIELIFALRTTGSQIQADFQNCPTSIWARNLAIGQSSRSSTYTLILHHGAQNWTYFALQMVIFQIRACVQNCHI